MNDHSSFLLIHDGLGYSVMNFATEITELLRIYEDSSNLLYAGKLYQVWIGRFNEKTLRVSLNYLVHGKTVDSLDANDQTFRRPSNSSNLTMAIPPQQVPFLSAPKMKKMIRQVFIHQSWLVYSCMHSPGRQNMMVWTLTIGCKRA